MALQLIDRGHTVTMVCARHDKVGLGLPGNPDDSVRQGIIDGIRVIQFNLEYSNYMSLPKRALIFLRYALRMYGCLTVGLRSGICHLDAADRRHPRDFRPPLRANHLFLKSDLRSCPRGCGQTSWCWPACPP